MFGWQLTEQVISISEYRTNLFDYLKNRMAAIAPNLTGKLRLCSALCAAPHGCAGLCSAAR